MLARTQDEAMPVLSNRSEHSVSHMQYRFNCFDDWRHVLISGTYMEETTIVTTTPTLSIAMESPRDDDN